MRRLEGRSKFTSAFSPIMNNPEFQPGLLDTAYRRWATNGIGALKDFLASTIILSFEQMVEKYDFPKQDFFPLFTDKYHIMHSTILTDYPEISPSEKLLFQTAGRMSMSLFYGDRRVATFGLARAQR